MKVTHPPLHSFSPAPLYRASDSREHDVCSRPHRDYTFGIACLLPLSVFHPTDAKGAEMREGKNLRPSSHIEVVAGPCGPGAVLPQLLGCVCPLLGNSL